MTARRAKGEVVFTCNDTDCGRQFKVRGSSIPSAWQVAKREGWVTAKIGPLWLHWCSWVHRPNRDEHIPTGALAHADAAQRPVKVEVPK